jgi:hypothetical protein
MEMIYCPECGKKTPFRDEFAGKNLKCSCGQTFQAPSKKILSNQNPAIPPSSIKNPTNTPKPPDIPAINHGSYNPQIEKLIAIALKDGVVTDKERQILIKKAVEFGIDVDEFEMELDSRIPTKSADKPLMNIGNDNIVKANIKGGGNSGSGSGIPLMNIGNDNIINAKIDASTNVTHDNSVIVKGTYVAQQVTHDNSLKVKGTYVAQQVAQQTVINVTNTPGAEFIKSLSSFLERGLGSKKQIEEQLDKLPNDTNILLKTLSELCRFIFRELSKFYSDKEKVSEYKLKKVGVWGEDPIIKQIEYAKKILDKLHEVAFDNGDKKLQTTIAKLDEIVFSFPKLYGCLHWKETTSKLGGVYLLFLGIFTIIAVVKNIDDLNNNEFEIRILINFLLIFIFFILIGSAFGAYYFFVIKQLLETNKKSLQDDDKYLQDLIESIKTV